MHGNVTIPNGASYSAVNATTYTGPYVLSAGTGISMDSTWTTTASTKIILDGAEADILVNNKSLLDRVSRIEELLMEPGALRRDPELEAEYEDLKALAEQYQERLDHYREQKRVFQILKKQD